MNDASLIFYDTSRIYFSSYYLHGFNELASTHKLQLSISNKPPPVLMSAIQNPEWQHLLFAMVLFKFQYGNKECYFCIDTHDVNTINVASHADGFHLPLLQSVDAYFKVNYNPDNIKQTPELNIFREKIRSISQFFPARPSSLLSLTRRLIFPPALFGFKPGLGPNQPYKGYLADAKIRLHDLKNFQSLEEILKLRKVHKDIDIFFVTSFRQDPRHKLAMERRYQVMKRLTSIPTLKTVIGFSSNKSLPEKYQEKSFRRLNQAEYLNTLARAKLTIYTQGMERCISSKFSLAMALGIAVIGEPIVNNPELLTTHSHLKAQFSYTDPDEIMAQAINLATHPEKTQELGILNAAMFDNQLAPRKTAEYILDTLYKF